MKTKKKPLVPPDLKQCQCLKPNGHNFMTLGGSPGYERCEARPVVICTELEPTVKGDRRLGSMSLCRDCMLKCIEMFGHKIVFKRLSEVKDKPASWVRGAQEI